jgi:predicted nucleic acid-binding protein
VRDWDTSAIVPLLVDEATSDAVRDTFEADPLVVTWWGTAVECVSALARLEREGAMTPAEMQIASERLDALGLTWAEVQPSDQVRALASRLLRVHALRAADALQVAAALVAAEGHPGSLTLVSLDDRLALAAEREGLRVVRPAA